MERPNEAINHRGDIEKLLRKYPEWQRQIKTLKHQIEQSGELSDTALIEQYMFRRSPPDGLPFQRDPKRSKTEDLALSLDEIRDSEKLKQEAALRKWLKALNVLEMKLSLYDMATQPLTSQERLLITLHFHKGHSLRRLATGEVPLAERMPGAPSLYSLRQMKLRILDKVSMVLLP